MASSITSDYDVLCKIGRGAYGQVIKAACKNSGQLVAVKKTNRRNNVIRSSAINEWGLIQSFDHPNIIRGIAMYSDVTANYMVTELMACDLKEFVVCRGQVDPSTTRTIMRQVIEGLAYLESVSVLHRDIKPDNIFLNSIDDVKIGDFGIAKDTDVMCAGSHTGNKCAFWYRAPEILLERNYGHTADIWSAACVMHYMLTAHVPFCEITTAKQIETILSTAGLERDDPSFHIFERRRTSITCIRRDEIELCNWSCTRMCLISENNPQMTPDCRKVLIEMFRLQPDLRYTASQLKATAYFAIPPRRGRKRKTLV
ncbi:serine/threonine protein kinase US3B [Testudinid alphaherpesvirus 3]|uniref:Serine/threonine protein kinase US3B n=1 Tax=Testudinid alphaherpesvirus 3 TaxID=2560801 RepID=A0A0M3MXX5_9ALPH|nr:serine/threonine protein kinase US3B [Testudinid alphaherpesvirus 3]AKI81689.1 serine/threonine protein kinase US3B [Testudinid alphaherpesvirus 3]AKI81792.1 serine/threonine protein kinase US3B [Testudinid alphaherpesvirus 3]